MIHHLYKHYTETNTGQNIDPKIPSRTSYMLRYNVTCEQLSISIVLAN